MLDVVNTSTVRGAVSKAKTEVNDIAPAAAVTVPAEQEFVVSRVRMDNLLNKAILEYRSSETGEVVRQFPTRQQLEAFQRAERAEVSARTESISSPSSSPASVAPEQGAGVSSAPSAPSAPSVPVPVVVSAPPVPTVNVDISVAGRAVLAGSGGASTT